MVASGGSCARPMLKPTPKYKPSRTVPRIPQSAIRIRDSCADIVYLLSLLIVCPVRVESHEGSWPSTDTVLIVRRKIGKSQKLLTSTGDWTRTSIFQESRVLCRQPRIIPR